MALPSTKWCTINWHKKQTKTIQKLAAGEKIHVFFSLRLIQYPPRGRGGVSKIYGNKALNREIYGNKVLWDSPSIWGGNPLLWGGNNRIPPPDWGGNRYGVELWILWFGLFRDRPRKSLTKHFRHLKSFKKQVFEISIFEIVFLHITVWLPNVNSWNLLQAQTPTLATVLH